jgi:hypothetical protein
MGLRLTLDVVLSGLIRFWSHYHLCEHLSLCFSSAHHMTVLVILPYAFSKWTVSFPKLTKQENCLCSRSPRYKTKLDFSDILHSYQAMINHSLSKLHSMAHKL